MDKFSESLNQVFELAESVATPLGLCIVDVKFGQAGKRRTLEVTIHRKVGAVSLDDCEQISRSLEQALDEKANNDAPLIDGAYLLEVQSPGLERQLKSEREFRVFLGKRVMVQAKEKVEELGDKFIGTLYGVEGDKLTLHHATSLVQSKKKPVSTKEEVILEFSKLAQVRLHFEGFEKAETSHCSGGEETSL